MLTDLSEMARDAGTSSLSATRPAVAALMMILIALPLPVLAETEPQTPCSERYGQPRMTEKPVREESFIRLVETGFGGKVSWGVDEKTAQLVKAPIAEKPVIEIRYPKGSSSPSASNAPRGGAGFYATSGLGNGRNAACLTYRVWFPEKFDFVRGGKLPGLFGGKHPPSGGARPQGDDGFTVRLMWRRNGEGEIYLYAPNMEPTSEHGGQSIGRGAWTFQRGRWNDIELEVVMNNPGSANGAAAVWIDGKLQMFVNGIRYRSTTAIDVSGLMFSTFFGGTGSDYAPSSDQIAYFDSFTTYGARVPERDKKLD